MNKKTTTFGHTQADAEQNFEKVQEANAVDLTQGIQKKVKRRDYDNIDLTLESVNAKFGTGEQ